MKFKFVFLFAFFIHFSFYSYSKTQEKLTIEYPTTSFIVSLKNLYDGGQWVFNKKNNPNIVLISQRKGQIYSYFRLMIKNKFIGKLLFSYTKDNKTTQNTVFKVIPSNHNNRSTFGDMPELTPKNQGALNEATSATTESIAPPGSISKNGINQLPNKNEDINKQDKQNLTTQDKIFIQLLIENESYKEALKVLTEYVDKEKAEKYTWVSQFYIHVLEKMKDYNKAVQYIGKILKSSKDINSTDLFTLYENKAKLQEKLGKTEDSKITLLYLQSLFMDNPRAYYLLGKFYLRHKDTTKANNTFLKLTVLFPGFKYLDEVFFYIAEFYKKYPNLSQLKKALIYYKKVMEYGLNSSYYLDAKKAVVFLENNFFYPY